jgi:penicillin-insensitive murein endopeptidase
MPRSARLAAILLLLLGLAPGAAGAGMPAKGLFGRAAAPSDGPPAAHGGHAAGCLAGGVALPETGPGWQAMRLSRNRNWGHPETIAFIRRLARAAREIGWPRIHVGDISQPRGGPMVSGHRSHQTGLDVDIWFRRPGANPLSRAARERVGSPGMVAPGGRALSPAWTGGHARLLRAAARDPAVTRIFVNPAIKRALCRATPPAGRAWLRKVRPWWGHDSHFHVRLHCPADSPGCAAQDPPPPGDGCDDTLAWWFTDEAMSPVPGPPRAPLTLADLPPACAPLVAD